MDSVEIQNMPHPGQFWKCLWSEMLVTVVVIMLKQSWKMLQKLLYFFFFKFMSDTVRPTKRDKLPASAPRDVHCQGKPFKVRGDTLGAYQWSKEKSLTGLHICYWEGEGINDCAKLLLFN